MMGLNFLALASVGVLKPIRNALALDGLAESEFYKAYLVSTFVILLAPLFNHLSDRIRWRTLIPGTAAFFVLSLIAFRLVYSEGSATLGMIFYGWYDLFAAALVTQFFMAVQVFFNARDAKSAVPLVIAAGSLGATLGNLLSGTLAQTLGTPNLLLLAALFVGAFAVALPFVWTGYPPVRSPGRKLRSEKMGLSSGDFARVFSHPHIRLIAGLVLLTVVVKTLVDYQWQEAVGAFFVDRDAIASFQGYVFSVLSPLPILVLLPLRPVLKRWGVGLAVLMLPVVVLGSSAAMVVAFSVWTATVAKGAEQTLRYSAERVAREVLYVPVPTELKLKAKAYIDMAIEKGLGKGLSGVLIFLLLFFLEDFRQVAWIALALAVVWCFMAVAARRKYVVALADSIRGRFATLDGGFASLTERSTLAMVEEALRGESVDIAFGLDLVEQAGSVDARHLADEMELLLDHPDDDVRTRVLRLLARFPGLVPEPAVRAQLADGNEHVREAAVAALAAVHVEPPALEALLRELLESAARPVRCAVLSWLGASEVEPELRSRVGGAHAERLIGGWGEPPDTVPGVTPPSRPWGDPASRQELALAGGLLNEGRTATEVLGRLLDDEDPSVALAAVRSAGLVGSEDLQDRLVSKLGDPLLRGAAKTALTAHAEQVVELCARRMADQGESASVRSAIPAVLVRTPSGRSVDILIRTVTDGQADRGVRFAALKALNKLRAANGATVRGGDTALLEAAEREVDEAERYATFLRSLGDGPGEPEAELLRAALHECWLDRREAVFRLLGLVFSPDTAYRSYSTLLGSDDRSRANSLEWLERTLGHGVFRSVRPVLDGEPPAVSGFEPQPLETVFAELARDPEPWIASISEWGLEAARGGRASTREDGMDRIEKVFLLQKVDLLQGARSSHLGLLASIADEVEIDEGEVLMRAGEPNEALYVLIRGSVEIGGVGDRTLIAREDTPFGTWSLIDTDPSPVHAKALEPSRLLRITRGDFQALLQDRPELATGILQALARRVRSLVA